MSQKCEIRVKTWILHVPSGSLVLWWGQKSLGGIKAAVQTYKWQVIQRKHHTDRAVGRISRSITETLPFTYRFSGLPRQTKFITPFVGSVSRLKKHGCGAFVQWTPQNMFEPDQHSCNAVLEPLQGAYWVPPPKNWPPKSAVPKKQVYLCGVIIDCLHCPELLLNMSIWLVICPTRF